MTRDKKKRKREKKSVIKERRLLFRTLRYAHPYRGSLIVALTFAFFSAFLGAATLLPFVPLINHVIDPKITQEVEDRSEKRRKEQEDKITQLELAELLSAAAEQGKSVIDLTEDPDFRKELINALDRNPELRGQLGIGENQDLDQLDQVGLARSNIDQALDDIKDRIPFYREIQVRLSARKNKAREELNEFLEEQGKNAIKIIAVILVIAAIIKAVFEYQAKYHMATVIYHATQKLKLDLYSSVLELDFQTMRQRSSGNILARLSSDTGKVRIILQALLTQSITVPFQIFFFLILLLILSVKVTLITMVALPVIILPITTLSKKLRKLARRDAEEDAYLVDVMQETLHGMEIVKAFGSEKHERKRFRRVSRGQVKRQIRRQRVSLAAPAVTEVLTTTALALVLVAGTYVVLETGEMSPGAFLMYLIALTRFYKPLKGISNGLMKVQNGLASAERVFEIIDASPAVIEKPDAIELPTIERAITFENVSFSYSAKRANALQNFTLTIPKGRRIALVGSSGAGKTTVTKLLPRFYDPLSGSIKVDGHDLRDVTFLSLRRQIAIVTQETILFDATIYENIAYGRRNATPEEVEVAARAANAHDFIMALPQGYHTPVGERASQLSGGQRQRLAIARAIVRNAPILILDEATSALDNESETLVQQALDRLMQGRTVIVVAHRLSTIRDCDEIIVMEKGTVVEQGSHEELVASGGRYFELCRKTFTDNPNAAAESTVTRDEESVDEESQKEDEYDEQGSESRA